MNYEKIYKSLIDKRRNNKPKEYSEKHHIVPRCLGGTDDSENLIYLTAREHYLAHYMLCKIYPTNRKLWHAFGGMSWWKSKHQERYIPSRIYSKLKEEYSKSCSENQSGNKNSNYGTKWVSNLETKQSFKIKKEDPIPNNCIEGRIIDWSNFYMLRPCSVCGKIGCISKLSAFCSLECKQKKRENNFFEDIRNDFFTRYKELKSLNKTMKEFGFLGGGGYFETVVNEIMKCGDKDVVDLYLKSKKKYKVKNRYCETN